MAKEIKWHKNLAEISSLMVLGRLCVCLWWREGVSTADLSRKCYSLKPTYTDLTQQWCIDYFFCGFLWRFVSPCLLYEIIVIRFENSFCSQVSCSFQIVVLTHQFLGFQPISLGISKLFLVICSMFYNSCGNRHVGMLWRNKGRRKLCILDSHEERIAILKLKLFFFGILGQWSKWLG